MAALEAGGEPAPSTADAVRGLNVTPQETLGAAAEFMDEKDYPTAARLLSAEPRTGIFIPAFLRCAAGLTPPQNADKETVDRNRGLQHDMYFSAAELLLGEPQTDDLMRPLIICADGLTSNITASAADLGIALNLQDTAFNIMKQSEDPFRPAHLIGIWDRMATSYAGLSGRLDDAVKCFANIEATLPQVPPNTPENLIPDLSFYRRARNGDGYIVGELRNQSRQADEAGNPIRAVYFDSRAAVAEHIINTLPPPPTA